MSAQAAPSFADPPPSIAAVDPRALRQVLGAFVTGVTVITTIDAAGKRWGLTANSFTSVSLNPPLILWNQSTAAPSHPAFRSADRFAVNILAEDQVELSRKFSGPSPDKFADVAVREGLGGVPLIEGCAAYLECTRETSFPGGDHEVFIGRVHRMEDHARAPLVFGQGRYLVAQPHEYAAASTRSSDALHSQMQALRLATPVLIELSRELDRSVALSVWGSHGPTVVRWEQPANDPLHARLPAGQVCSLLTSATGLAWAAFGSAARTAALIEGELQAPLPGAPATAQEAYALIDGLRARGIARVVGSEHFTDRYGTRISAAAAPVFDGEGRMVLALTAVGDAQDTDVDWKGALCTRLRSSADRLSSRLGFQAAA